MAYKYNWSILLSYVLIHSLVIAQIPTINNDFTQSSNSATNTISDYQSPSLCKCDLTQFVCDSKCCCDTVCAPSLIINWTNNGQCYQDDYQTVYEIPKCYDFSSKSQTKTQVTQYLYDLNQYNQFTCLQYINLPYSGLFFLYQTISDTVDLISTQLDLLVTQNSIMNQDLTYNLPTELTYQFDDLVKAQYKISSTDFKIFEQILILPAPDVYGNCQNTAFVKIYQKMPPTTCRRILKLDGSNCVMTSPFGSYKYLDYLKIYQQPSGQSIVSPIIGNVYTYNQITGEKTKLTVAQQAAALNTIYSGNTCSNFIKEVFYKFSYTLQGLLTVQTDFVVIGSLTLSADQIIQQSFGYDFIEQPQNSKTSFQKSGNAGYFQGQPLLFGKTDTTYTNAIVRNIDGQKMIAYDNTNGQCTTSQSDINQFSVINFGQNLQISCYLPLTAAQLQTQCTSSLSNYQIFKNFDSNIYFGKFGNANYNYIKDWIQITQGKSLATGQFDSNSKICQIQSIQQITIFYAKAGFQNKKQDYIVSAEITYDDYTMWKHTKSNPVDTQNFQLSLRVQFIQIDKTNVSTKVQRRDKKISLDDYISKIFEPLQE